MRKKLETTEAGRWYATALDAQYLDLDLGEALRLYRHVILTYPNDREAEYARIQIQHIVDDVVPSREWVEVQVEFALGVLEREATTPDLGSEPTFDSPPERRETKVDPVFSVTDWPT